MTIAGIGFLAVAMIGAVMLIADFTYSADPHDRHRARRRPRLRQPLVRAAPDRPTRAHGLTRRRASEAAQGDSSGGSPGPRAVEPLGAGARR